MDAVAAKLLLVRPGDYVLFNVSGSRLLVVVAIADTAGLNKESGELTSGQELTGLMTSMGRTMLTQFRLDWSGYQTHWTIARPEV